MLLSHFPLSWTHLTSTSQSLIHLASNPPTSPLLSLYFSSPCAPLLPVQQDRRPVGASPPRRKTLPSSRLSPFKKWGEAQAFGSAINILISIGGGKPSGQEPESQSQWFSCRHTSKQSRKHLDFKHHTCLYLQVRSRTSAHGKAASGDSPGATNWRGTTANTPALSLLNATTVTGTSTHASPLSLRSLPVLKLFHWQSRQRFPAVLFMCYGGKKGVTRDK